MITLKLLIVAFAIFLVVCFLIILFIVKAEIPSSNEISIADTFLSVHKDAIYQKLVEATKMDNEKVDDYFTFEDSVLQAGYILSWNYIKNELSNSKDGPIPSNRIIKKLFTTSDFTIDYIKANVVDKSDIRSIINALWTSKFEEKIKELEEEEDIAYGIDENGNKVPLVGDDYVEDIDTVDIPSTDNFDSGIAPNLEQKIIPPSENPEYITEVDDNDEIIIDSRGRKRNKKNGRFV